MLDATFRQVEPDVRVQVVVGHDLQQQLESDVRPLGMKQGNADVVHHLNNEKSRLIFLRKAKKFCTIQHTLFFSHFKFLKYLGF